MSAPLRPAAFAYTGDGTPCSPIYGDVYHSADGGPGQAAHVFLAGNGLPGRWRDRDRFVVLETGFGTDLNFLATWAAWREDRHRCRRLHYLAVEKHPFRVADLATLHAAWPQFAPLADALRNAWPCLTPGFHRREFEGGRLVLTLLFGDAAELLPALRAAVDAFYLDGFSPTRNPDLWSPAVFAQLARLAGPRATLATWSVAATVRAGLHTAGFETTKVPGFGHKREMLTGRVAAASGPPPSHPAQDRRAIVIGAGLAGSACCERLAVRGWEVTLVERLTAPAGAASGNPAGIVMPKLSRHEDPASRLSRAAFLYTVQHWQTLAAHHATSTFVPCGVLQVARDERQAVRQREAVQTLGLPADFLRYLDRDQASAWLGHPVVRGGWWFPMAGWAVPPEVCRAALGAAAPRLHAHYAVPSVQVERTGHGWLVSGGGRRIAEAPVAVLASGAEWHTLAPLLALPIQAVRGQITRLAADTLPRLHGVVCGQGYLIPAQGGGMHTIGATYDRDADPQPRADSDRENLHRLAALLPGIAPGTSPAGMSQRVGFRAATPDRLPIVGALSAEMPGLYGLLGYGSRGLTWAALMAEMLACRVEEEPSPVEDDLLRVVDPARFEARERPRGAGVSVSGTAV